jgi:3-phosphoshikimate 1-carboxyvinyltransferase
MEDIRTIERFPGGAVALPSSKSISHRAVICAGLSPGTSQITHVSWSQDIEASLRCMRALGSQVQTSGDQLTITGGLRHRRQADLDCGESGTTLRLLIPAAALCAARARFTGRGRLLQRPLAAYLSALAAHGVTCASDSDALILQGFLTPGIFYLPGGISSQFVSGLLLALPLLPETSEIRLTTPLQSAAYVDLTLDMMAMFGVTAEHDGYRRFIVSGGQCYQAAQLEVEADYSQGAFFLVAGALGYPCELIGLSPASRQGDREILAILERSGVQVETTPSGGLIARPGVLHPQTVDVSGIPDLVPPLAALFTFCPGVSRLVNAGRLRHKESDRLAAVSSALNDLGADVTAEEDALIIRGVTSLNGGYMDSSGDHRIAMMGAVAAGRCRGTVRIRQSQCIAKSYPDFWRDFEKIPREAAHHG